MTEPTFRQELDLLHAELAAFRAELASEVRTRRLVVVDDAGAERICTDVNDTFTELQIHGNGDDELHAAITVDGPSVMFSAVVEGHVVAMFSGDRHVDDDGVVGGRGSVYFDDKVMDGSRKGSERSVCLDAERGLRLRSGSLETSAVMQLSPGT